VVQFTAVVTAHGEGLLLRPTLRSVSGALRALADSGVECELLVQLDGATESTQRQAAEWASRNNLEFEVRIAQSLTGDAGSARNAGVEGARGIYIALCDGDDLVSSNYFLEGLSKLKAADSPTVVHPETLISFGDRPSRWLVRPSTDPTVTIRDLIDDNLWPSSSIGHRSVFETFPHPRLVPGSGFGPEDWTWNLTTAAAGVVHEIVERTVFFYRTRPTGGVNNQHGQSVLPPTIDLDALRRLYPVPPAPQATTRPGASIAASVLLTAKSSAKRLLSPLPRHVKDALREIMRPPKPSSFPIRDRSEIQHLLLEAARIDPSLSWHVHNYESLEVWVPRDNGNGAVLDQILLDLQGHSDALVMVPWIGVGGADLVSRNYLELLQSTTKFADKVSVLATYLPERTLAEMIPDGVNFVQVDQSMRELSPERQHRLFAQIIVWSRPRLVIGVNCFDLVQALGQFSLPICEGRTVFLTLFAFDQIGAGYPVNPITDDAQRAFLDSIDGIVTDNTATKATVEEMLGVSSDLVRVHRQPALNPTPALRRDTAAFSDVTFDEKRPFRLLWPHRLDGEKRPRAVIEIARRVRSEDLPVTIDVYGQRVLDNSSSTLIDDLKRAGVNYKGPYSGGLVSLPTEQYHAMLLTSAWEGLPLVLVQSMMLGLPVIATSVGGVQDLVEHARTGMLVTGPDDIDGFVAVIKQLMESEVTRRSIISEGYAFAIENYSWEGFAARVGPDLGITEFDARAPN